MYVLPFNTQNLSSPRKSVSYSLDDHPNDDQ